MSAYRPYPKYKPSGVEWLGDVPEGWEVTKLKFTAAITPSNIDKKSYEDELPISLCNYTDVYYNETITPEIEFMPATATREQIRKFSLKQHDVIITKDSEDPNDIAVPSLVAETMDSVVCGYHLTLLRPTKNTDGRFLKRYFDSKTTRAYFSTRANGLTRYGLGSYPLSNADIALPSLHEQHQIASFLDRECGKLDALQAKQERLIDLLKEKRQALISHAVTRGLDPNAKLKPSGIEWLGDVPEHWIVGSLKHRWLVLDCKHMTATFVADGIPLASIGEVRGWKVDLTNAKGTTEEDYLALIGGGRKPNPGDILFTRNATVGEASLVPPGLKFAMGQDVCLLRKLGEFSSEYLLHVLKSRVVTDQLAQLMIGSTFKRVNVEEIRGLMIPVPPLTEQRAIVAHLDDKCGKIDRLMAKAERAIALLKERRSALISAAVTGKIDVRGV